MAADVGGLIADIGLNVAGLRQDIGKANRELKSGTNRMNRSLGKLQRGVDKAVGRFKGLVGVIGAIGFARMTQQAIANTAALSEQADAANINVETFQELTKAFSDMAGVDERITGDGLRRFNRRLGLARQGTGAAVKTLERLNISLEQDTTAALEEAIQKLTAMDSATDQTAAASQLFGEDAGPKMAAALAQGQDALDATIKKLREQGRVMSEDTAASARKLNDRYNELADTLKTKFRSAVVESVPLIQKLTDLIGNAFAGSDNEANQEIEERILKNRQKHARALRLANDERFRANQILADRESRLGPLKKENDETEKKLTLLEKIDAKAKEMNQSQAGLVRGGNPLVAFGEAAEESNPKIQQSLKLLERIDEQVQRTDDNTRELGFTFSSAFEDAIVAGAKMRDVLRGLLRDITRIIVRTNVSQPLGQALASGIAGLFSGGSTPSGLAGTGGSPGPVEAFGFAGGGFTGNGPRSGGIDGKGGFPAVLHPNETVIDHKAGSGVNQNVTIDARGADKAAIVRLERALLSLRQDMPRIAVQSVNEAQARS